MSGVNAHAIFSGNNTETESKTNSQVGKFKATRHWPSPKALYLVGQATISDQLCSFIVNVASPEMSFLGDHQVCGFALILFKFLQPFKAHIHAHNMQSPVFSLTVCCI
jgi:hypothetical protein